MNNLIDKTLEESIFYEDSKLVVALAYEPITKGHSVVIWKNHEKDINKLSTEDYEYLMDAVDVARDTLRKCYSVEKVYLMYLDEANWVHWHLIPRYDEKGFSLLNNNPSKKESYPETIELEKTFKDLHEKMIREN